MYTIKQAAARTGLSIPTIRAWERRYGVVSPDPDPGRLPALRRRPPSSGSPPCARWSRRTAGDRARQPNGSRRPASTWRHWPASARDRRWPANDRPAQSHVTAERAARRLRGGRQRSWTSTGWSGSSTRRSPPSGSSSPWTPWSFRRSVPSASHGLRATLMSAAEHAASETVRRRLAHFFDAARGPMMQVTGARRDAAGRPA